jgi:hypothetical protein
VIEVKIKLTRRDFYLMLAGLMSVEDAPDSFRCSLRALNQPPANDSEVIELGERILAQLEPPQTTTPKP